MSNSKESNGIGLAGILFIVFLVLKLTGNITWSWWWITSPIWIPVALYVSFFTITVIIVSVFLTIGGSNAKIIVENWKEKLKIKK
jgi:hypothetical protein